MGFHAISAEMDFTQQQKNTMLSSVRIAQASQIASIDNRMLNVLSADRSDTTYQNARFYTTTGLELGSLAYGGYALAKGALGLGRLFKAPSQVAKITTRFATEGIPRLAKSLKKAESFVNRGTSFAGSKRAPLDYAPYQRIRNESTIINGRKYTGHALDRMQDRGLMPSVIENTINTGCISPADFPGGLEYYDSVNKIRAIVGKNGQIITIIPGKG
jgi:hypothetical protein